MTNAREEFLEHIGNREVEFVSIAVRRGYRDAPVQIKGTLADVLPLLDFEYSSGYGGQELYGYIWYKDGTWSDRGEYDGSEWWQHQRRPDTAAKIVV